MRLATFSDGAHAFLRKAVEKVEREGAEGIVLDLRGNGGGLLEEAVLTASIFLPEGEVVVSTESRTQGHAVYKTVGGNLPARADRRPDRPQHRLRGRDPHRGARRRRRRDRGRHPLLRQGRLPAGDRPLQRRRAEADDRRVLHRRRRSTSPARGSSPTWGRATIPEPSATRPLDRALRVLARSRQATRTSGSSAARLPPARRRAEERPRRGRGAAARGARARRGFRAGAGGRGAARGRGRARRRSPPRRDLTDAADLHRRPGDRPRLRRRRLGPARGRRRRGSGSTSPTSPPTCGRARALDREARRRANSTYVPGTVEPMLPQALSEEACSLAPGVERLAVTAEIELGADGAAARGELLPQPDPLRRPPRLRPARRDLRRPRAAPRRRSPSRWRSPGDVAAALGERRGPTSLDVESCEPEFALRPSGRRGRRPRRRADRGPPPDRAADDPRQRAGRRSCSSASGCRRSTGSTSSPTRRGSSG